MITIYLIKAISLLFEFIKVAILVEVVLSWVMPGKRNQLTEIVKTFTAPFLVPGRMIQDKIMPGLMVDFSPILGLILADILQSVILKIITFML